jgi:hypothetical protein
MTALNLPMTLRRTIPFLEGQKFISLFILTRRYEKAEKFEENA